MQPDELAIRAPVAALGANETLETLFREHCPQVAGLLTRLTGDRGQAEEIAADVFSKLAGRPGIFQSWEHLTAWVYRVATNAGLDAVRALGVRNTGKDAPKGESLGKQVMEGVTAEGTRETSTLEAGAIGNDRPIQSVSESWYSPELQTLIKTVHADPRTGEETFRLSNITRVEPPSTLFQVPAEYQVVGPKLRTTPVSIQAPQE